MTRTDHYNDPNAPQANSLKVAVSALVRDEYGRILMIHRTDNDKYSIPGGGQEVGETVSAAVVREVHEETGIDVEVTGIIGVFSDPDHVIAYDDGEVRQEFSICFSAKPIGGETRPSAESKEVRWVAPQALAALDIHPSIKLRIEQGLRGSPEPYFT
ncbi:NUDIX domain-containing protein [Nocardia beijingensis]|uniref:NUDIX hydrolase n=1 Tax=Nocardia beijingensis TaxID=95162 RepID=UPI0018932BA2|nr:NUDIX domain-containing protein [Nocardia beijingensis]MBF6467039.1 NUDIX domain-containing protein [Nocardia beijingensis]